MIISVISMIASTKTSTKVLQVMLFCGILMIFAATAQAVFVGPNPTGNVATNGANCGNCHTLSVNGTQIATSTGFPVAMTGTRDAATWASTISRMISSFGCPFPNTTAAINEMATYLAQFS